MNTEEELMQSDPEYKEYLEAHPTEWIDTFIRERLMPDGEVAVESKMVWLFRRIGERLKEKFFEWAKEIRSYHWVNERDYDIALQWESFSAYYDVFGKFHEPDTRGWIVKIKVLPKDKEGNK